MGTDIYSHVEVRRDGRWEATGEEAFDVRDYGLFGFLAAVRNHSHAPVIAEPRGLPNDAAMTPFDRETADDGHSASWLLLSELLAFDYDQVFWDRRIEREESPGSINGAALAEEGEGRHLPLREFLGEWYFARLDQLGRLAPADAVRIVFWFN